MAFGADFAFPSSSGVTATRTLDKTTLDGVDSITGTLTVSNSAASALNGLFVSEYMPASISVRTVSVKVNGATVTNYVYSASSAGQIYPTLVTHTWVLEAPAEYGAKNPVNAGNTLEIIYVVKCSGQGTVPLEGYAFGGKLGAKTGGVSNVVLGYCSPVNLTVIAPPAFFSDNFNDNNADGWTVGEGTWTVQNGQYKNTSSSGFSSSWAGDPGWTDITITADITLTSNTDSWIIFRVQDRDNYYIFTLQDGGALWLLQNHSGPKLADASGATFTVGNTYTIQVVLEGNNIKVYSGTTKIIDMNDNTFSSGRVGFGANGSLGSFDNIEVTGPGSPAEEDRLIETKSECLRAFPNPFKPVTTLILNGNRTGKMLPQLTIYDIHGRIVEKNVPVTHHAMTWNASRYPSGIYMAVLKIGNKRFQEKLVLMK
jgi:hypothetical protein